MGWGIGDKCAACGQTIAEGEQHGWRIEGRMPVFRWHGPPGPVGFTKGWVIPACVVHSFDDTLDAKPDEEGR